MLYNNVFFSAIRDVRQVYLIIFLVAYPHLSMGGVYESPAGLELADVWAHSGLEEFSQGTFGSAGNNLYVNAKGVIEIINRFDVNHDGFVDIVLANSHDRVERGPTWVYTVEEGPGEDWNRHEMSADSGWASRVVDLDGDGYNDLVTVNSYNGVTAELFSYVYWGGADGPDAERTDLPTIGAYDVVATDINRDGRLDLILPSAWKDPHNPAPMSRAHVYLQGQDRTFQDEGERYGILATGAVGIAAKDLNGDGYEEIVLACLRKGRLDFDTESMLYWGTPQGVNAEKPFSLPTFGASQVMLEDLNQDGEIDIIFCGTGQVRVFWNEGGTPNRASPFIIELIEDTSDGNRSAVRGEVADVDRDGIVDLVLATSEGVQIRSADDLDTVKTILESGNSRWVTAADLDGDERPELIVSKHFEGNEYRTRSPIYWNGSGGYSEDRISWVPTRGVLGNTTGDLDGDGKPEVIFNNVYDGHITSLPMYIYLGNEEAAYGVENRLELTTDGTDLAINADLNLDGYNELVVTIPKGIRIYRGRPNGPVEDDFVDLRTGHYHNDLEIADFDRDGYLDLLPVSMNFSLGGASDVSSSIFYGSEEGFAQSRTDRLKNFGYTAAVGDINNDGYLDIAFQDKRDAILFYLGSAHGFSDRRIRKIPCHATGDSVKMSYADLNGDGWLDLIVSFIASRLRLKDTFRIFYGGPQGYGEENMQEYFGGYSARYTGVADYNNDGNLDLLVTAYGTPTTREPPAQLFWGNGDRLDLENPVDFLAYGSGDVLQIDLNRDGWIDIVLACHRDDIGHQVDSLIYWNSPDGFFTTEPTRLPGLGPHGMFAYEHGNAFTREPEENYVSPPFEMGDRTPGQIHWRGEETVLLKLTFQLRWAETEEELEDAVWTGPRGGASHYETSGESIEEVPPHARWLQYRATFISPYGCGSPKLSEVSFVL